MQTQLIPLGYCQCQCGCGQQTKLAASNDKRHGHVRGEPVRFVRGHQFRGERVSLRYVEEDRGYETPCWIWQLYTNQYGYGNKSAHRKMFERHFGPIPDGLHLDHLCRVPPCVNPAHLEPVTNTENVRRGLAARIDMATAEQIRSLYAAGGHTHRSLGRVFGLSHNRIGEIVRGEAWV